MKAAERNSAAFAVWVARRSAGRRRGRRAVSGALKSVACAARVSDTLALAFWRAGAFRPQAANSATAARVVETMSTQNTGLP